MLSIPGVAHDQIWYEQIFFYIFSTWTDIPAIFWLLGERLLGYKKLFGSGIALHLINLIINGSQTKVLSFVIG